MVREVLSDLDTPLSVYLKLADGPHTYLFESVEGGETWGRYSIIGLPARLTYTFRGNILETRAHGEIVESRTLETRSPRSTSCAPRTRCRACPACRPSPAAWSATSASSRSATSSRAWPVATSPISSAPPTPS
jgi:anthranilate/para-aminobenzoate synthase component I